MLIESKVEVKQTVRYVCERLPPDTLRGASQNGQAIKEIHEELIERHQSGLIKTTLQIKGAHAGEGSRFCKVVFTVSKEAATDLDREPFVYFDFERRPVKRLVAGFIQCSKCGLFSHVKKD